MGSSSGSSSSIGDDLRKRRNILLDSGKTGARIGAKGEEVTGAEEVPAEDARRTLKPDVSGGEKR